MSDRKYRQRGYQDEDRGESASRRGGRSAPRSRPEGPRGRGLGRPTQSVFCCARCGQRVPLLDRVEADAVCPNCDAALHTCTHCQFFDTAAPLECRQPIEERIARKSERNDCDSFEPRLKQEFESTSDDRPDDPRAAFDALFKS